MKRKAVADGLMVKIARIIFLIPLVGYLTSYSLFAQSSPKICGDYPADFEYISSDVLSGPAAVNCDFNVQKEIKLANVLPSGMLLNNARLHFNVTDNFDPLAAVGQAVDYTTGVQRIFPKGKTWVVLTGEASGRKVLTCKSFEFLDTAAPQVSTDLCTGNPIQLEITDNLFREKLVINWGDNQTENISSQGFQSNASHIYSAFYSKIEVAAVYERNSAEVCPSAPVVINRDVPSPVFLTSLEGMYEGTEVKVKYRGDQVILYELEGMEEQNGAENWIDMSDAQAGEGTVIGLNPEQKYCFRLRTENACGEHFYSQNTLCNIVIDREVLSGTSMKILWNKPRIPADDATAVKFRKKSTPVTGEVIDETDLSDPLQTEFTDTGLNCGEIYNYQIEALYPPVHFEGADVEVMIKSAYLPKKINDAQVNAKPEYVALAGFDAVDETKIDFRIAVTTGDAALIDRFYIYKLNPADQVYHQVSDQPNNLYTETGIEVGEGEHCYRYQLLDVCGVLTDKSDPFCTVNLKNIRNDSLKWSPFIASAGVYQPTTTPLYIIEYFDSGAGGFTDFMSLFNDTTANLEDFLKNWDEPELKLRVVLNQNIFTPDFLNFPVNLYSNSILYTFAPKIFVPTVFTPDGSGPSASEHFRPLNKFVKSGSFKILDRSGNLLFASKDLNDAWDGKDTRFGKPVPVGTYFYVIEATGFDNKPVSLKGAVSVLK